VGTPTIWAARYLTMNGRRRLLGSFNHGSMANALPQAIGAQASHRRRQVIALSGDGGLAMLMGDLLTLRQHELPIKVVVFRNDALAFVELEMKAAGILDFATSLQPLALAGSCGECSPTRGRLMRCAEKVRCHREQDQSGTRGVDDRAGGNRARPGLGEGRRPRGWSPGRLRRAPWVRRSSRLHRTPWV